MRKLSSAVVLLGAAVGFAGGSPSLIVHAAEARVVKLPLAIRDMRIVKPNLVIRGANLSKVEIWYWPTGTGIEEPSFLGAARPNTAPGAHESWAFPIPIISTYPMTS